MASHDPTTPFEIADSLAALLDLDPKKIGINLRDQRITLAIPDAARLAELASQNVGVISSPVVVVELPSVVHPIAGTIHPHRDGPCSTYMPDGRSEICARCDWPDEAHGRKGD